MAHMKSAYLETNHLLTGASLQSQLHSKVSFNPKSTSLQGQLHSNVSFTSQFSSLQNQLHFKINFISKSASFQSKLRFKVNSVYSQNSPTTARPIRRNAKGTFIPTRSKTASKAHLARTLAIIPYIGSQSPHFIGTLTLRASFPMTTTAERPSPIPSDGSFVLKVERPRCT